MLIRFVLNNIRSKMLRNTLVMVSVLVSVMLVMLVFNTGKQINKSFQEGSSYYNIVVGARGSDTQVVLNALFFYEDPAGNIPYTVMETIESEYGEEGSKTKNAIAAMVPIGMGDYLHGFKIIGTTRDYFNDLELAKGEYFGEFNEEKPEIVVGYNVARMLSLELGDEVTGAHGDVAADEEEDHTHANFAYTIVGILKKTDTPNDNATFTQIEAVWAVHDHANEEGEAEHNHAEGDITAILIRSTSFSTGEQIIFDADYMASKDFKVISSAAVLRNVLSLFGSAQTAITVILVVVIVLAFNMLFLAMFTAASERQKEIAVLRALGSNKTRIFITIILEAVLIALVGTLGGWLLSRLGLIIVGQFVSGLFGIHLTPISFFIEELFILLASIFLSILATLIPATMVYRTAPHKYLQA